LEGLIVKPGHATRIRARRATAILGLLAVRSWFAGDANGADCVSYEEYSHWVGRLSRIGARAVALGAGHAYVASRDTFRVVSLADPATPVTVGTLPLADGGADLTLRDGVAFVTAGHDLVVVSVADTQAPSVVGFVTLPKPLFRVVVHDDLALVLGSEPRGGREELYFVDLHDLQRPSHLSTLHVSAADVAIAPPYAYAFADGGCHVLSIEDPRNPWFIDHVDFGEWVSTKRVLLAEDTIFVAGEYALAVLSIANPRLPVLISTATTLGGAHALALDGDQLWIAGERAVVAVDARDRTQLTEVGLLAGRWRLSSIDAADGLLVVGSTDLRVAATAVPAFPPLSVPRSSWYSPFFDDFPLSITADNRMAFASSDHAWLFSLADPSHPVEIGAAPTLVTARGVALTEDLLIVGGDPARSTWYGSTIHTFVAIPIADFSNPYAHGELPLEPIVGVVADGSRVFASSEAGYLYLIRASQARSMEVVRRVSAPVGRLGLTGTHLYIAGRSGLSVFSIEDPLYPVELGRAFDPSTHEALALAHVGPAAYVVDETLSGQIRLVVYDVSDPTAPSVAGTTTLDWPGELHVAGGTLYLGGPGGPHVFDLVDPLLPRYLGSLGTPGTVFAAGPQSLYLGNDASPAPLQCPRVVPTHGDEDGWPISPAITRLAAPTPNPSDGFVTIEFALHRGHRLQLGIYDVAGRLVRTLATGVMEPGIRTLRWDGHDEKGQPSASGTYFVRLEAGGHVAVRPIALAR
jgi:hypothetical protein